MSTTSITETCQVVWWKGYVKGRFVAVLESDGRPPEVVGESPSVRWRGSDPPDPTEAAVHALDALTARLVEAGWTVGEPRPDVWFGLVLSRPATAPVLAVAAAAADPSGVPVAKPAAGADRAEPPAVERLHLELVRALEEVERERRLRQEAERQAPPVVALAPPRSSTPAAAPRWQRSVLTVVELATVAAVGLVSLLLFDSAYAAAVAALTAGAVALGLDSLFAVRAKRELAPPR